MSETKNLFCDIFYLAIITLGWSFEHIVKSTKSLGMGQTNNLFCNARVSKMSVQTTLSYQSETILVSWSYFIIFRTSLFLLDDPKNFTQDELGPFFILLFTLVTLFTHLYFIYLSLCNVFGSL